MNPAPRLYCEQRRNSEIGRYCFTQGGVLDSNSEPLPEANVQDVWPKFRIVPFSKLFSHK